MKYRVKSKLASSADCMVCGLNNPLSLKTKFYAIETPANTDGTTDKILVGITNGLYQHQSYPNRMHGGAISALLDETIGRTIQIDFPDLWGVTGELNIRFKKPVPLGEEIKVVGKLLKNGSRTFGGAGFIEDKDGNILATGSATYIKLTAEQINSGGLSGDISILEKSPAPDSLEVKNLAYFDMLN